MAEQGMIAPFFPVEGLCAKVWDQKRGARRARTREALFCSRAINRASLKVSATTTCMVIAVECRCVDGGNPRWVHLI